MAGTVTWRPLTFICMEGVAERQEELARALGQNRLAGGEARAVDQDLAAAFNEADVDLRGRHQLELAGLGSGHCRPPRRPRAPQVPGQVGPTRVGAFDPVVPETRFGRDLGVRWALYSETTGRA
jgi:hypothetical protein